MTTSSTRPKDRFEYNWHSSHLAKQLYSLRRRIEMEWLGVQGVTHFDTQ